MNEKRLLKKENCIDVFAESRKTKRWVIRKERLQKIEGSSNQWFGKITRS